MGDILEMLTDWRDDLGTSHLDGFLRTPSNKLNMDYTCFESFLMSKVFFGAYLSSGRSLSRVSCSFRFLKSPKSMQYRLHCSSSFPKMNPFQTTSFAAIAQAVSADHHRTFKCRACFDNVHHAFNNGIDHRPLV